MKPDLEKLQAAYYDARRAFDAAALRALAAQTKETPNE